MDMEGGISTIGPKSNCTRPGIMFLLLRGHIAKKARGLLGKSPIAECLKMGIRNAYINSRRFQTRANGGFGGSYAPRLQQANDAAPIGFGLQQRA
jgi:hypothetical protein